MTLTTCGKAPAGAFFVAYTASFRHSKARFSLSSYLFLFPHTSDLNEALMKGPFTRYERELHREKPIWRLLPLLFFVAAFLNFFIFDISTALITALIGGIVFVMRQLNLLYLFSKEAENLSAYHPLFTKACEELPVFDTEKYHPMAFKASWFIHSVRGYGAGFLWQPNILITCKHCVGDIHLMYAVNPASGRVCRVRNVAMHPDYDIAILELEDHNIVYECVTLANSNAEVDAPIWTYKHLTALSYAKQVMNSSLPSGELTKWAPIYGAAGYVNTFNPGQQKTLLNIIGGMSGSPVFNTAGDVVGMAIASAHHCSYILPVDVIHATLKSCAFTKRFTTTA